MAGHTKWSEIKHKSQAVPLTWWDKLLTVIITGAVAIGMAAVMLLTLLMWAVLLR
jgi:hypothetical protein